MRILMRFAAGVVLAALSACSESTGPGDDGPPEDNSLALAYSAFGDLPAGTFAATGDVVRGRPGFPGEGDYVFAHLFGSVEPPRVRVVAARTTPDGLREVVTVLISNGARAGTTLAFQEVCGTARSCAEMSMALRVDPALGTSGYACRMASGELRLIRIAERRVTGTFSGAAVCYPGQTQVSSGTFDAEVLDPYAED